ncbi:glucokinase [Sphingomonas nostoxanthinifaciens]|uniref:glucokinase n=1 Tax=Sphingomonas nostoxanthinifaciens TaxID=2872652 RepID=UPI001CC1FACC|nr:glucokinase [Sphingomonas nostoxanthinifaciens]UAK25692.1 glucokinase [Sphingomonas nostoxanthinifaciens]
MTTSTVWILADLATAGTLRFALAGRGALTLEQQCSFSTELFTTFSDALLSYARQTGVDLRNAGCVLSVPGPTTGSAIRVARSSWTLSRAGLGGMLGKPIIILNDMVATAWSLPTGPATNIFPLGRASAPDFALPGRWTALLLDDGVGAATLTVAADGHIKVADTELGHTGFSPASADEFALMQSLRGYHRAVSWEQILSRTYTTEVSGAGALRWATLAGAFAGDALLATAAWSGIILCGSRAGTFRNTAAYTAFAARAADRSVHGRFIEQAQLSILVERQPLKGCLAYLRSIENGATKDQSSERLLNSAPMEKELPKPDRHFGSASVLAARGWPADSAPTARWPAAT